MKLLELSLVLSFLSMTLASCQNATKRNPVEVLDTLTINQLQLSESSFQKIIEGKKTDLYLLKNKNHALAAFSNYGGRIISLMIPDISGKLTDVVVGLPGVEEYQQSTEPYFGAIIGRYGNRIARGKFSLDGKDYSVPLNNGSNALHGGKKGFQDVIWDARQLDDQTLEFSYLSKDMEEGFPGNLQVKVRYTLTDSNELKIDYEARTDKKTVINLTNHAFFNLNGEGSGSILDHHLQIMSDQYTPVDSTLIPTGKLESVQGSPFDFRASTRIGNRIDANNTQLKNGKGYDHNFVLNIDGGKKMKLAAIAEADRSGIIMEVWTTEPGLQFYSGNFMEGKNTFKGGSKDDFRTAFCLETQHFPDSPNRPEFPGTVLKPGEVYKSSSAYLFKLKE